MFDDNTFLQSPPCKVEWDGWTSDTWYLQRAGWEFSVEKDFYRNAIRILMRHAHHGLCAISQFADFQGFEYLVKECRSPFHFQIVGMSQRIIEVRTEAPQFHAIDATPTMTPMSQFNMHELNVFRPAPMREAEEVLVDKADMSVIEHLEAIKDLQSEKQKELRAKARRGIKPGEIIETIPTGNVVVQMVNYK